VTDALMLRLLRSGVLAAPHPLDPPHPCCWIAGGEDYEPCGLWCGHDGDHTPYVPGAYLPPPIIGPLELLTPLRRSRWPHVICPLCQTPADQVSCGALFRVHRDSDGSTSWNEHGEGPGDSEYLWRFEPCGCEGRELLDG
jgi:hypothetical protein